MLGGVSEQRIQAMAPQEVRWLDNAKKAFFDSDCAFRSGAPEHKCFEGLCKAVDTAKTLSRCLQGKPTTTKNNRKEFIDFIYSEVPCPEGSGLRLPLVHARTGKPMVYGFGELIYEIRCMIHENENLNITENPDYHILLDWTWRDHRVLAKVCDGRAIVNGRLLWNILRQFLAKFLTVVESIRTFPVTRRIEFSISPPLGSIQPTPKKPRE